MGVWSLVRITAYEVVGFCNVVWWKFTRKPGQHIEWCYGWPVMAPPIAYNFIKWRIDVVTVETSIDKFNSGTELLSRFTPLSLKKGDSDKRSRFQVWSSGRLSIGWLLVLCSVWTGSKNGTDTVCWTGFLFARSRHYIRFDTGLALRHGGLLLCYHLDYHRVRRLRRRYAIAYVLTSHYVTVKCAEELQWSLHSSL